ncbi:GNAT family N-acetyltransferase, partial [bacterium]|nr:GNAT family N-acetyltransferase [bacterium]
KEKNSQGKYELDSDWRSPYQGYYCVEGQKILGFCIIGKKEAFFDIMEFYVLPEYRRKNVGKKFAFSIFNAFDGKWQVRQIEAANAARAFWRSIIKDYSSGDFVEEVALDPDWGKITRQRFESKP